MPGFLGVVYKYGKSLQLNIDWQLVYFKSLSLGEYVRKSFHDTQVDIWCSVVNKFSGDKICTNDGVSVRICDGIFINRVPSKEFFISTQEFKDLYGSFAVLQYDGETLTLATDHISSKPIFYYADDIHFIFGTELRFVIGLMKLLSKNVVLDKLGSLSLLELGYMVEDFTLVNGVKKLQAGKILVFDLRTFSYRIDTYFDPQVEPVIEDRKRALNLFTDIFKEAVELEWKKDSNYGYAHMATISGGLDARTNVLMAKRLGFKNINVITFGQSDYWDERIVKRIARDQGFDLLIRTLDNGDYLLDVDKYIVANSGLASYAGAAHGFSTVEKLNWKKFGILHSGQLGDAVLGTYIDKEIHVRNEDLRDVVEDAKKKYETNEKFVLYNRGYNGILNGNWTTHHFTEMLSPFLYPSFIEFSLCLHPSFKYGEKLYIDWLKTVLPESYKYPWESLKGLPPGSPNWLVFLRKAYYGGIKRVFGQLPMHSMNPFEYWFRVNEKLRNTLLRYYKQAVVDIRSYGISYELGKKRPNMSKIFNTITLGRFIRLFIEEQ